MNRIVVVQSRNFLIFSTTMLVMIAGNAFGIADSTASRLMQEKARTSYAAGLYDSTIGTLKGFVRKHGRDPANETMVPLLLEALARKGDIEFSPKLIEIYLNRYPLSAFVPRVRYLEGVLHARQEDYTGAVVSFSMALTAGVPPTLDSLVFVNLWQLCDKSLSTGEMQHLITRPELHPRIVAGVRFCRIRRLYQGGQGAAAESEAAEFIRAYPRSPYLPAVREIAGKSRAQQKGQVPFGVLAPLTGYDAEIGKKVVQGIQLAVDRHNRTAGTRVTLIMHDTRSSMIETALRTRELTALQRVPVIIGPVLSQNAVVCASMLMDKEVVMISPTATDDGIAGLGPNIFQVNVATGVLGRRMAGYAVNSLNAREFAIIAPSTDYGRTLAQSFREEAIRNGASVVAEEYFEEGVNDFRPQFQNLRTTLVRRKVSREVLEQSGMSGRESRHAGGRSDSVLYADSVLSVGAIFFPAETEDVVMLAPQVPFFKIKGQLLGTSGWHNARTIQDGKGYVNNAVIATMSELDKDDPLWRDFTAQYGARFGGEPDRVVALGFDAADLACRAVAGLGGDPSGKQISRALHAVKGYKGLSGMISFDENSGANREAAIVKISDKKFVRIE